MAYTTIDDPSAYFKVQLYTGNNTAIGSGGNAITFNDTDTDMQPDLVWIKARADTESHKLYDSARGVTKDLESDLATAEGTDSEGLTAFGSDGFTIGNYSSINASSQTYVAWCWKESATSGFDIVSYTGNGSSGLTVSHSLSAVPKLMIIKNRSGAYSWAVYHGANTSAPETESLFLDVTDATSDRVNEFNDTAPTSSIFTVGDGNSVNNSSENFIAYLFAEKQGYSKFGTFTGNGNADGTFVPLSFRPAFLIIKETSNADDWQIWDNKREDYTGNPNETTLDPATNGAELDSSNRAVDFLSNGFKLRTSNATINTSGETFLYIAFAEQPFVNSNGVPCNAR